MSNVIGALARVYVDDLERALPLYQDLTDSDAVTRFEFGEVRLAWIDPFLLIDAPREKRDELFRNATLLVQDIDAAADSVRAAGGTILEGPGDAPNGPRMIARHPDESIFEYIQPTDR